MAEHAGSQAEVVGCSCGTVGGFDHFCAVHGELDVDIALPPKDVALLAQIDKYGRLDEDLLSGRYSTFWDNGLLQESGSEKGHLTVTGKQLLEQYRTALRD